MAATGLPSTHSLASFPGSPRWGRGYLIHHRKISPTIIHGWINRSRAVLTGTGECTMWPQDIIHWCIIGHYVAVLSQIQGKFSMVVAYTKLCLLDLLVVCNVVDWAPHITCPVFCPGSQNSFFYYTYGGLKIAQDLLCMVHIAIDHHRKGIIIWTCHLRSK